MIQLIRAEYNATAVFLRFIHFLKAHTNLLSAACLFIITVKILKFLYVSILNLVFQVDL